MEQINISVGDISCLVECANQEEKQLITTLARELNTEYNELTMECGKLDKTVLLFFLLFRTQSKISGLDMNDTDANFTEVLKSLKTMVLNSENIESNLIKANIAKMNELKHKQGSMPNLLEKSIAKFTDDVISSIQSIERDILLL